MAKTTGETIARAFELSDKGLNQRQIAVELHNSNIPAYLRLRPDLDNGIMPPDKGSAYSLRACREYIDNYRGKQTETVDTEQDSEELDIESFKVLRATFELGETARRAIDGLLAMVGVRL